MKRDVALEPGQVNCGTCGAAVWRCKFGNSAETRLVERAPRLAGHTGAAWATREGRERGHVVVNFPLPGTDGDIRAAITRRLTPYRMHTHGAFSAANFEGKRRQAVAS